MYAPKGQSRYADRVRQRHYYGENHLHYLTASIYRRVRVFDSDRFKLRFTQTLGALRAELDFRIIGYVLMPEHCHLLIWPGPLADPSQIMQKLAERTVNFILRTLRRNLTLPWSQRMLKGFELPQTVRHHAHYRVWQRGGYDMNIWSEKKQLEKLNYMHNNPVKRGLAAQPGDWPWSSWRFYYREDASILAMDRTP
ncbi:MAG: REP-associated tyrosine transposase [Terriglobia bacterium]